MSHRQTTEKISAQIACEAIINHPYDGWDLRDMCAVFEVAVGARVAPFYTDALADEIAAAVKAAREGLGL